MFPFEPVSNKVTLVVPNAVIAVTPEAAGVEFVPESVTVRLVRPAQPWLPAAVEAVLTVKASADVNVAD